LHLLQKYLYLSSEKMDERTVGVLGGGQLGRMMAEAGQRLGLKLAILDPGSSLLNVTLYR
jgi:phosphoglycerate dehydrogenase-like enzyme